MIQCSINDSTRRRISAHRHHQGGPLRRPTMLMFQMLLILLSARSRTTTAAFLPSLKPPKRCAVSGIYPFSRALSTNNPLARGSHCWPTTVALCASSTTADISKLSVNELKDLLRKKGSKVSGNKAELMERLSSLVEGEDEEDQQPSSNVDIGFKEEISTSDEYQSYPVSTTDIPPSTLQPLLQKRNITSLLPVQSASFRLLYNGLDGVIHAPTGSGKTLAFVVPLLARLAKDGNGSVERQGKVATVAAAPRIIVIAPSRELAKQVGREWHTLHPRKTKGVATVFGGAPLERNVAALKAGKGRSGGGGGVDVVVGTAGRLRELVREGYLTFAKVQSLVLDEADSLLNFKDNPDVEQFLNDMENDYQLVLASATINKWVRKFAMDIMEIDESSVSFVTVTGRGVGLMNGDGSSLSATGKKNVIRNDLKSTSSTTITNEQRFHGAPAVRHWSIAARGNVRRAVVSDLITTLHPRMAIIFVPTKAEVEAVGAELSEESGGAYEVRVLHGDMVQSARSRTVALLRGNGNEHQANRRKILVATDVASRGLDLDGIDLVIQFGIPRKNGRENTYDAELYTHRTGRAGRVGGDRDRSADAVVLYDPTQGEGKLLPSLAEELKEKQGFDIWDRPLPSSTDVMDATYEKVLQRCSGGDEDLVQFFREKLLLEMKNRDGDMQIEELISSMLLDKLSRAMAALSGLEKMAPKRSLLTADPTQRTVRAFKTGSTNESIIPTTPPEITKLCKGLGTGKIGRVLIWDDGSAVFDLPVKKTQRLIESLAKSQQDRHVSEGEWHVELPSKLPPQSLSRRCP